MIWTDGWFAARHEARRRAWTMRLSLEEHSAVRWAILWRFRARLARAESTALRARLEEERLVADTAIRSLHMRIDNDEPIVRLARGLTFHPPGSLAHSQHLLELAALVEERSRHQRSDFTALEMAR